MEKENYWTKFCKDTNQSMKDVKGDFEKSELTFVDNASNVVIKHKSDKASLEAMKDSAMDLAKEQGDIMKKIEGIINDMLNCIRERDEKIDQLNADTEKNKATLGDWYNKAKQHSEKLCDELGKYTNDETGVLNIVAYILEEVVSKEGYNMEKAKKKVKGIILSRKCSRIGNFVYYVSLIVIVLAMMAVLFVMIGTDKGLWNIELNNIGKYIAGGFIISFLVGEVFLIIRICSLLKKRNREIQLLQLLLDKMEIHNMTKHEIDRELERIHELSEK